MANTIIYIVIPTFNRKETLQKLLGQIINLRVPSDNTLKTLVVIDGSDDGTTEMLSKEFPMVNVINGPGNWWWTKSINLGTQKALENGADHILWLNDDSEVKSDFLEILWNDYKSLGCDAVLGCASVSLIPENSIDFCGSRHFQHWRMKSFSYRPAFSKLDSSFVGVHPTWTLNGRGTFFSKEIAHQIGILDPRLVQYGSDYDFTLNAKRHGIPVFISWNARVYNNLLMTSEGATFQKTSLIKFLKSFLNKHSINHLGKTFYLYSKYNNPLLAPFFIVYTFTATLVSFLKKRFPFEL